ncbi:MAG: UbiA-like polyprenyltransferase [Gemmatimonadota bacterium]
MGRTRHLAEVMSGGGWDRLSRPRRYANFVKLPHTGFALPFALVGAIFASYRFPVSVLDIVWIVLAFTAVRFAAMSFNRLVDRSYDARNPRTADREIPSGRMSVREARLLVLSSSAVFVFAAGMLNLLCLALSPVALGAVLGYSYAKRFTTGTHLILGLADGIAPAAGYLAISGRWSEPWIFLPVLVVAVGFWIGGFDILYSMQDAAVDRQLGLRSIPAQYGERAALLVSRGFHIVTVLALLAVPLMLPELGGWYLLAVVSVAALLGLEHGLIDPSSSRSIQRSFFTVNVWLASVFAAFVLVGRLV